jgi:DnaJ-class molecular chaperone
MRLNIPKKETVKCPDCRDGKVRVVCACGGMIGNVCQYCNGDWQNAKEKCPTCQGTRRVEKGKE